MTITKLYLLLMSVGMICLQSMYAQHHLADSYPVVGWPADGLNCPGVGPTYNDIYGGTEFVDIARDPADVPPDPLPDGGEIVITSHEIETYLAPGDDGVWGGGDDVKFRFFAFGGGHDGEALPKVPGPFIRLTKGNTYVFTLKNFGAEVHAIDFHAIMGNKGGAAIFAAPGATTSEDGEVEPGIVSMSFTPQNPGLFVYHCVGDGSPHGIAHHMNNGMFGLILVEPRRHKRHHHGKHFHQGKKFQKLTRRAKEFYVFEQDIFLGQTDGHGGGHNENDNDDDHNGDDNHGDQDGIVYDFDEEKMLETMVPDHVVYNGRIGSMIDHPIIAEAGKNAVIYHGASGAHAANFHIIGEIFDWVFPKGDILSAPARNLQTVIVPSAGSAVCIMDGKELVPSELEALGNCQLPANLNILVDHASPYFRKGALGAMAVIDPKGIGSPGDTELLP